MNVVVIGATGLVGSALVQQLNRQYNITAVGRDERLVRQKFPFCKSLALQDLALKHLAECDVVINLAGENISKGRWNESRRAEIIDSRVSTTQQVVELCRKLDQDAPRVFNASAIGIYGLQETSSSLSDAFVEESELPNPPTDFLSEVAIGWENTLRFLDPEKVVKLRFAVVLARHGGALPKLAMPFYFGCGGPIASGQQAISWVALKDVVSAITFLLDRPLLWGAFNIVAPECLHQRQFARVLARVLKRPSFMWTPGFFLKLLYGQMAEELILQGQHVEPKRLLDVGFEFQYGDLDTALRDIYRD
ncbi:TIGR01777 family oxidoreductase [Piscirickettsia litoralis]|uniref:TIGR01777 family protein n=1 Tax=Piscirickettsia litoralis TaxID=1891921 RepID=A0ABX3A015_9GAMM|nr:TIGR01777 family oxidoreductase [Piscirickettsia litoralis]ODN42167.1 TIGR01777 family protein [Piscirickettsia litoralis]